MATPRFTVLSNEPNLGDFRDFGDFGERHEPPARLDPQNVVSMIEQTAKTIRTLQQENERVAKREEMNRATIERDRAQWRDDVAKLKAVAETCLERAAAAENELEESKAQTEVAILMCREAEERERHASAIAASAEKRAEIAEEWLEKISRILTTDVRTLLRN